MEKSIDSGLLPEFDPPARSDFYTIPIQHTDSGNPESLISYFLRVAKNYQWYPKTLINQLFPDQEENCSTGVFRKKSSLHWPGKWTSKLIQKFEATFKSQDYDHTTFHPLEKITQSRLLIARTKRWCSSCYYEQDPSGRTVYEPSFWAFRPLLICPRHQIPLSDRCPNCERTIPYITPRMVQGFCPHCETYLGECKDLSSGSDPVPWQKWLAETIPPFFRKAKRHSSHPSKWASNDQIVQLIDQELGTQASLAKMINTSPGTVNGWYHHNEQASFLKVLMVCYKTEITPYEFFYESTCNYTIRANRPLPASLAETESKKINPNREIPWNEVRKDIDRVIEDSSEIGKVADFANRFNVSTQTIRKKFSDRIDVLKEQREKRVHQEWESTIQNVIEEVHRIAKDLEAKGLPVKRSKIESRMKQPGFVREDRIRAAIHELDDDLET